MAAPLAIFGAVSAAVAIVGAVQQAKASKKQADAQAAIDDERARIERQNTAFREDDFRRAGSRDFATRRAALGGSGVSLSEGSPLLVSEDFAGETELQALRIRRGGETVATRLNQQASLTRSAGSAKQTAALLGAGRRASLLISGGGTRFGGGGSLSASERETLRSLARRA